MKNILSYTTRINCIFVLLFAFALTGCNQKISSSSSSEEKVVLPEEAKPPKGYEEDKSPTPLSELTSDCFEKVSEEEKEMCADVYDPVCGCNKVNYSNPCQAKNAGIKKWTKGRCE